MSMIFYILVLLKCTIRSYMISIFLIGYQISFKGIDQLMNFGMSFSTITCFYFFIAGAKCSSKTQLKINKLQLLSILSLLDQVGSCRQSGYLKLCTALDYYECIEESFYLQRL